MNCVDCGICSRRLQDKSGVLIELCYGDCFMRSAGSGKNGSDHLGGHIQLDTNSTPLCRLERMTKERGGV